MILISKLSRRYRKGLRRYLWIKFSFCSTTVKHNRTLHVHKLEMAEINLRQFHASAISRTLDQVRKAHAGELDASKAEQLLNSARSHYDRMLVNHEALLSFAKDEELEVHSAWWDVTEEMYNDLCSSLMRLRPTKSDELHALREGNIDSSVEFKLAPLHMPSFDGALHNWLAFKDAFETLVHNRELPTAQTR